MVIRHSAVRALMNKSFDSMMFWNEVTGLGAFFGAGASHRGKIHE